MARNQMTLYAPSTNAQLANALSGFGDTIKRATENELAQNPDWEEYTETEKRAMVLIGALKNINGVDLMAMQLRYQYLNEIERTNALTAHPEHYQTLTEMAAAQGISVAELSKIKDLCGIVFPYLQNVLGKSIAELWANVGKSKFFEVLGLLKVLITNEPSQTNSVNSSVDFLVGDATATDINAGFEVVEEDENVVEPERQISRRGIRHQVIENILQNAEELPSRELRNHTRPVRTAPIQALVLRRNGTRHVVATMDEGQFEMMVRALSHHIDSQVIDLPEDPAERQEILFRRPEFRRIYTLAGE